MLNNIFKLLIIAVVCLSTKVLAAVEQENGVYILTEDNFDQFVKENEFVLVEFYAPWCGHCKALTPEYEGCAKKLEKDKQVIKLAKVDATQHEALAETYDVKGYPTLYWFKEGVKSEYSGGRTSSEIMEWVLKKSGPAASLIDSIDGLEAAKQENKVLVIAVFDKIEENTDYTTFMTVASTVENVAFYYTTTTEVAAALGDHKVVLYKHFDDLEASFEGEIELEKLKEFVNKNRMPWVMEFGAETQKDIFGGDVQKHSLLFGDLASDEMKPILECYTTFAKKFIGKLMLITVDTAKSDNGNVMSFFNIKPEDKPTMRIINLEEDMLKFNLEEGKEFGCDVIEPFIQNFLDGKLEPFLNTEEVPEDWDKENVKVLVGKNFYEIAFDKTKAVFVEFYAPWCGHCKALAPVWDELAEVYKDQENLIIAKMDSTANEIKEITVEGFPTIKYFALETNEIISYEGGRDLDSFKEFLAKQLGIEVPTASSEEKAEEKEEEKEKEEKEDDEEKEEKEVKEEKDEL